MEVERLFVLCNMPRYIRHDGKVENNQSLSKAIMRRIRLRTIAFFYSGKRLPPPFYRINRQVIAKLGIDAVVIVDMVSSNADALSLHKKRSGAKLENTSLNAGVF